MDWFSHEFNLLSRWFVGLGIDDQVWDANTCAASRVDPLCRPQHLGTAFEHCGRRGGEHVLSGEPGPPRAHRGGLAWVKTVAGLSKPRHRGLARVGWQAGDLPSDPPAEASGSGGVNAEPGSDRPASPRTMAPAARYAFGVRFGVRLRDPQCHNRPSRRSDECDVPTGLTPQTATQAPIPAASSAAC